MQATQVVGGVHHTGREVGVKVPVTDAPGGGRHLVWPANEADTQRAAVITNGRNPIDPEAFSYINLAKITCHCNLRDPTAELRIGITGRNIGIHLEVA